MEESNQLYRILRDHEARRTLRDGLARQIARDTEWITERHLTKSASSSGFTSNRSTLTTTESALPKRPKRSLPWSPVATFIGNSSSYGDVSPFAGRADTSADSLTAVHATQVTPPPPPQPLPPRTIPFPPPPPVTLSMTLTPVSLPLPPPPLAPPPGDVGSNRVKPNYPACCSESSCCSYKKYRWCQACVTPMQKRMPRVKDGICPKYRCQECSLKQSAV